MASSSGSTHPCGGKVKPEQAKRLSSRLEVLLEKLHYTNDNPAFSCDAKEVPCGSSKRKPKVIRQHRESTENTEGDEEKEEKTGNTSIELNCNSDNNPLPCANQDSEQEGDDVTSGKTVDSQSNYTQVDGTMVVQPEAVVEKKTKLKGPDWNKSRKSTVDNLDIVMCTGCNKQVNPNLNNAVRRHPVLRVLICKKCYEWYTSDDIDQDSDGMDEQCRWCGEGGNLMCCDFCHNAFCKGCIKRNLGRSELSSVADSDKWHCYVCKMKPLKKLISECDAVLDAIEERKLMERECNSGRETDRLFSQGSTKGKAGRQPAKFSAGAAEGNALLGKSQPSDSGTVIEPELDITVDNAKPVLARMLCVTTTLHMFLTSLYADLTKEGHRADTGQKICKKAKRGISAYSKLCTDIKHYSRRSKHLKRTSQGKKFSESATRHSTKSNLSAGGSDNMHSSEGMDSAVIDQQKLVINCISQLKGLDQKMVKKDLKTEEAAGRTLGTIQMMDIDGASSISSPDEKKDHIVDVMETSEVTLPNMDKDIEEFSIDDFLSVYKAALDAEVNKESDSEEQESLVCAPISFKAGNDPQVHSYKGKGKGIGKNTSQLSDRHRAQSSKTAAPKPEYTIICSDSDDQEIDKPQSSESGASAEKKEESSEKSNERDMEDDPVQKTSVKVHTKQNSECESEETSYPNEVIKVQKRNKDLTSNKENYETTPVRKKGVVGESDRDETKVETRDYAGNSIEKIRKLEISLSKVDGRDQIQLTNISEHLIKQGKRNERLEHQTKENNKQRLNEVEITEIQDSDSSASEGAKSEGEIRTEERNNAAERELKDQTTEDQQTMVEAQKKSLPRELFKDDKASLRQSKKAQAPRFETSSTKKTKARNSSLNGGTSDDDDVKTGRESKEKESKAREQLMAFDSSSSESESDEFESSSDSDVLKGSDQEYQPKKSIKNRSEKAQEKTISKFSLLRKKREEKLLKKRKQEKLKRPQMKRKDVSDSSSDEGDKKKQREKKTKKTLLDDSDDEDGNRVKKSKITKKSKTGRKTTDSSDSEDELVKREQQVKKKRKRNSSDDTMESEKKVSEDKKVSDSSNYDSELEKEIDKFVSIPKISVRKLKASTKDPKGGDREKSNKEKDSDQSSRTQKKKRRPEDELDDLHSGSSSTDDPEEDQEADQKEETDDEDRKRLEQVKKAIKEEEEGKMALLALDSDSDPGSNISSFSSDQDDDENKGEEKKKAKSKSGSSESDVPQKTRKKRHRNALLNAKLSDSEDEGDSKQTGKKKVPLNDSDDDFKVDKENEIEEEEEDDDFEVLEEEENEVEKYDSLDDFDTKEVKPKKKKRKNDGSDDEKKTEGGKGKRKRKRIKAVSDSSEETEDSDAPKPQRKRKRKKKGDASPEEEAEQASDENTPGKKRRNIKKIIKDKKLSQDTKEAAKAEEERRKRIKERQQLYNQIQEEKESEGKKVVTTTKLVLEIDKDGDPLIEVHKDIIKKLKPHQVEAVKFLWDCLVESMDRLKEEEGAGCILAHCMGLGKTLSVISFIHTLLTNSDLTNQHSCIVVCPLNTVLNWQNEFEKWQPKKSSLDVYELTTVKDNWGRADRLKQWHEDGGIMIMGYEMYRNLSQCKRVRNKKQKKIFVEALVDPGPDLVVCDEGHILKNDKSSTSIAMNGVRTKRRVVLTGTPLQNNLTEYHCMVNFVKPSLLGTRKEFSNRFVNPITNGQCANASKWDVKLMKKRAHILHETLAGCVQRRDYAALTKFLPPKYEYILSIRLSKVQCELYQKYLEQVGRSGTIEKGDVRGASLFSDYQNLSRIWTHPWILKLHEVREQNKAKYDDEDSFIDDEEDEDDSFIDDSDDSDSDPKWRRKKKSRGTDKEELDDDQPKAGTSSGKRGSDRDSDVEIVKKWNTRSRGKDGQDDFEEENQEVNGRKDEQISSQWWADYVNEDDQFKIELSGKLFILAEVLKMAEAIGDKVLVFSQSLLSLDLIEEYLDHWDKAIKPENPEEQVAGIQGWTHGVDYFRMDGSTNSALRKRWSEIFNDHENPRARLFLISTKAGSLGTNMVGANRCIIFDASWNPTHDVQSIFRVYRFGQDKPVYIYRFLAQGTMEEKIYERQVTKQSLSCRVVDEHQIERHFTAESLQELYSFTPDRLDNPDRVDAPTPALPKDRMLAEMLVNQKDWIVGFHEHDSLLENKVEEELTEEERKAAWEEYEAEKKGLIQRVAMPNYPIQQRMQPNPYNPMMNPGPGSMAMFPHLTEVARAIRAANPNVTMVELQQRLEHYMRLQMASQHQLLQQQQQQHQMRYGGLQQHQMMGGPEPGEVTFLGYGSNASQAEQNEYKSTPAPDSGHMLYSMLNGSKKE